MSGSLTLDAKELDLLTSAVSEYGDGAESIINDVLHQEAGPIIVAKINPLIHPSGRTFKGHRASANVSDWPRYDTDENLAISIGTKSKFHYLYFPDDGSNTKNHAGNQQMFYRGGVAAIPEVIDRCLAKLSEDWS